MKNVLRLRYSFPLMLIVLSACGQSNIAASQEASTEPPNVESSLIATATRIEMNLTEAAASLTQPPEQFSLSPVPQATEPSGSSDPYPLPFIKPADSDSPAAGICDQGAGDIVDIKLGTGPDGLPLAGRCVQVTPSQRLKLINPTSNSLHIAFSQFDLEIPSGSEALLDKPVGNYLARGVHFLPNGPEIWLVELTGSVVVTVPPPVRAYVNSELGYSLAFTGDWMLDESGMTSGVAKEVIFYPPNPEPFVAYVSILIDSRTLDELEKSYADFFPDAQKSAIIFAGEPGFRFALSTGRVEIIFSHQGRTYLISTDRPNDTQVQAILASFSFIK